MRIVTPKQGGVLLPEGGVVLEGREPLLVYLALTALQVMRFAQGREPTSLDAEARRLSDALERYLDATLQQ